MYQIFGFIFWWSFIFLYFLFSKEIDLNKLTLMIFLLIIWIKITVSIANSFEQEIYKKEKISTLIPFENLQKIFVVIVSYFIFWWTSVTTLLITIASIFVILGFSIDFKKYKLPTFFNTILVLNLIFALESLLTWYFLKVLNFQTFYSINYVVWFVFIVILILSKKEDIKLLLKQTKKFYTYRFFTSIFWNLNSVIYMYLISQLWMVITILLSFLSIWFKIIFAYFFLKEIPARKDIILTIILAVFIWCWYYFK